MLPLQLFYLWLCVRYEGTYAFTRIKGQDKGCLSHLDLVCRQLNIRDWPASYFFIFYFLLFYIEAVCASHLLLGSDEYRLAVLVMVGNQYDPIYYFFLSRSTGQRGWPMWLLIGGKMMKLPPPTLQSFYRAREDDRCGYWYGAKWQNCPRPLYKFVKWATALLARLPSDSCCLAVAFTCHHASLPCHHCLISPPSPRYLTSPTLAAVSEGRDKTTAMGEKASEQGDERRGQFHLFALFL